MGDGRCAWPLQTDRVCRALNGYFRMGVARAVRRAAPLKWPLWLPAAPWKPGYCTGGRPVPMQGRMGSEDLGGYDLHRAVDDGQAAFGTGCFVAPIQPPPKPRYLHQYSQNDRSVPQLNPARCLDRLFFSSFPLLVCFFVQHLLAPRIRQRIYLDPTASLPAHPLPPSSSLSFPRLAGIPVHRCWLLLEGNLLILWLVYSRWVALMNDYHLD